MRGMDKVLVMDLTKAIDEMGELVERLSISKEKVEAAISRSINRTIVSVRYELIKQISADTRVKQKLIRKRFVHNKSTKAKLSARLSMYAHSIPAALMGFRESKRGGILVQGGFRFRNAFFRQDVQRTRGKARDMILERQGGPRYPLFERRIAILDKVSQAFDVSEEKVIEIFTKNLLHELRYQAGLIL